MSPTGIEFKGSSVVVGALNYHKLPKAEPADFWPGANSYHRSLQRVPPCLYIYKHMHVQVYIYIFIFYS